MKKTTLFVTIFVALLFSCDIKKDSDILKKNYKYIEITSDSKDEKPLIADNDTLAYLEAYKRFLISNKVYREMKEKYRVSSHKPLSFILLDYKNKDITNSTLFITKLEKEREIEFLVNKSVSESGTVNTEQYFGISNTYKVDSLKVKNLKKYFRIKKDEFSTNAKTWYEPISAPKYVNQNGLYCYFSTENGFPNNLRFKFQYYADDWLFVKYVIFSVDGKVYEYFPSNVDRDSGNGGFIWEWFDESVNHSNRELINSLAHSKNAKMKIVGRQYHNIKAITKDQILSINRTIELYIALGGSF